MLTLLFVAGSRETGKDAILESTGKTFDETAATRRHSQNASRRTHKPIA
jgi:hypothetical protein